MKTRWIAPALLGAALTLSATVTSQTQAIPRMSDGKPDFSGIYTADNMDYIQRDAYMTGFSLDMVDIDRPAEAVIGFSVGFRKLWRW